MSLKRQITNGLRGLFHKREVEAELDAELRAYQEAAVKEKLHSGMKREEALRAARMEMGAMDSVKENVRDASWESRIESAWRDISYGWRMLCKSPGSTIMAITVLAIAIGVNTTAFSFFNSVVLRPLPIKDANRVVSLYRTEPDRARSMTLSYPEFAQYRDHNTVFSAVVAQAGAHLTLTAVGTSSSEISPEPVSGQMVSGNYFDVLGAAAVQGRTFSSEEDRVPDERPVAVLSYNYWQRRFGEDPGIVGQTLKLNTMSYTVIGIAPADFIGTEPIPPDLWVPVMMLPNVWLQADGQKIFQDRNSGWLQAMGRLKPGVSIGAAQAEMTVLAKHFNESVTDKTEQRATITLTRAGFLSPSEKGDFIPAAALVMALVGMVLLIACANVANLQLARGAARQKELGIRTSLGATRGRLVRQLLAESLLLAGIAGIVGVLFSYWAAEFLLGVVHPQGESALRINVAPDWRVLLYALGASVLTGVAFGLLPALRVSRQNPVAALRGDVNGGETGKGHSRLRGALIVSQVAASLFLLVTAGLLARALVRAQSLDLGYDMNKVVVVAPGLRLRKYSAAQGEAFLRQALARVEAIPGVVGAALTQTIPLGNDFHGTDLIPEGITPSAASGLPGVNINAVSPRYFETMGIPLLSGRGFTEEDGATNAPVRIISESAAKAAWPGQNPIGKRFRQGPRGPLLQVIGVARNARNVYLWADDIPYVYAPIAMGALDRMEVMNLVVRTKNDPRAVMSSLAGTVREVDPKVSSTVRLLSDNLANWTWPSEIGAAVSAALGFIALLLAATGIFGVTSFVVRQRTREIGIRMALGAQPADVLRLFLRQGGGCIMLGLAIGLALAFAVSRVFSRFLYGLNALDAVTFVGASAVLGAAALAACWIPARRATRVDPLNALRYE
jgi:predicted permease